jgi:hypothetical protein
MRSGVLATVLVGVFGAVLAPGKLDGLSAAEAAMEIKWDQLVPPAQPRQLKTFFGARPANPSGSTAPGSPDHGAAAMSGTDARWMSAPAKPSDVPAAVVAELDGKRIHIGGYVVPLDFDSTRVKEFLLVPFVGACIHVPPPPANQIVYVKSEAGIDVKGTFDPVWVTGTLKVTPAATALAEAGYSLDAEKVELRPLKQ